MNKKHIVLEINGNKQESHSAKDWARKHKEKFPEFSFEQGDRNKTTPITNEISNVLIENNYKVLENDELTIYYKRA